MGTTFPIVADYPFQWNELTLGAWGPISGSRSGREKPLSRLAIPARDDVSEASKPILDAVQKQLGVVPNMLKKATHLADTSVALNRRRFSLGLPLLVAGAAAPQEVVAAKAPSR